jgi:hypothetical protein
MPAVNSLEAIEAMFALEDICSDQVPIKTKFNISMEKKIERLWHESERHGWNFNKFVSSVLEVITVLHHRKKLKHMEKAPQRASPRKRALS